MELDDLSARLTGSRTAYLGSSVNHSVGNLTMRGEEGDGTRFVELAGKIDLSGREQHRPIQAPQEMRSSGVSSVRWSFVEPMRQCISVTQTSGSVFDDREAESTYRYMLGSQHPGPPLSTKTVTRW